jgi:hypothetical protein
LDRLEIGPSAPGSKSGPSAIGVGFTAMSFGKGNWMGRSIWNCRPSAVR